MSAKYSLLVFIIVGALLLINSLWLSRTNPQESFQGDLPGDLRGNLQGKNQEKHQANRQANHQPGVKTSGNLSQL